MRSERRVLAFLLAWGVGAAPGQRLRRNGEAQRDFGPISSTDLATHFGDGFGLGGRGQRLQVAPQQQSPAPFPEVFNSQQQQGFGQQQSRFQNFPQQQQAFPQQQFQPQQQQQFQQQPFQQQQQFSSQQQQFDPRQQFSQRQQQFVQQHPQQQFSGAAEQAGSIIKAELPQAPGAGSLFDSIVKKINNGHREKARRKQASSGRGRNPTPAASSDPFRAPLNRPRPQPSDNRAPVADPFSAPISRPRSQQLRPNNPQQTSRARPGQSETVRRPVGGQVATGNRRPAPALGLALFGRGEVAPAFENNPRASSNIDGAASIANAGEETSRSQEEESARKKAAMEKRLKDLAEKRLRELEEARVKELAEATLRDLENLRKEEKEKKQREAEAEAEARREKVERQRALVKARQQEREEQRQRALEEKRKAEVAAQKKKEAEEKRLAELRAEEERRQKELEERRQKELEEKRQKELEAQRLRDLEAKRQKELEAKRLRELEEKRRREREEELRRKKEEERRQQELEEKKAVEHEIKRLREVEEERLIEQEARDKRLRELELANERRQLEAAKIKKDFENLERKYLSALRQLKLEREADLEEIGRIEEANRKSAEQQKNEIVEATNILATFLDPTSPSGSQLNAPSYIWSAINELSRFLKDQEVDVDKRLAAEMEDLVGRAEQRVRSAKSAALTRNPFPVTAFPVK